MRDALKGELTEVSLADLLGQPLQVAKRVHVKETKQAQQALLTGEVLVELKPGKKEFVQNVKGDVGCPGGRQAEGT